MKKSLALLLSLFLLFTAFIPSTDDLEAGFAHPPMDARPIALWDWTNGNFSLSQITHELEEAKAKGMGGFDIWDVGVLVDEKKTIPAGPPFMGDESVQAIGHTVREADRLGLRLGLIISSSWNAGGTWVKPEHGAMGLFQASVPVRGPAKFSGKLPFPKLPATYNRSRKTLIAYRPDSLPTYFREVAVLAVPANRKTVSTSDVRTLTASLQPDGSLTWEVPAGDWVLTRYVCAPTGQPLMVPSPNANGRMIDHFSAEAMDAHLGYFLDKLKVELGSLRNRSLRYLYTDSYEVNSAIWTPRLPEEFRRRTGYDLAPYLPVLDGTAVGSAELSARFLFDFRKVLSDLIIENHYRRGVEVAGREGLGFVAEAGGPGPPIHNVPFEDLKALGALTYPRGEFWNKHPKLNDLQIVKGIASAAHLYNQRFVEAEAFTSVYVWQEGPTELKPLADRAFCEGLNRIVYHTFPHTPPEAGSPGWVYNFGTLMQVNNPWWPKSKSWHEYLSRSSFLLQAGNFVGDVALYYGDDAPNFVSHKKEQPGLGFGFDYDVVNTESILKFLSIKNGKLTLPSGQTYEVLALPPDDRMNLDVLKKLEALVRAGATVVGRKPSRTHGLAGYEAKEREIRQLADRLWGRCDSVNVQENRYGLGKIVWGKPLRQVLAERGIGPDVQLRADLDSAQVDFIHRRRGTDEIYFVRNTRNAAYDATLTFRVSGKTPQLWNPATGEIRSLPGAKTEGKTTNVRLRLDPHDAFFVVFRTNPKPHPASEKERPLPIAQTLDVPWELRFPHGWGTPARVTWPALHSWSTDADSTIRYFSGIVAYHTNFEVPAAETGGRRYLDLGRVREVADVWLNGRHLGERCVPPYRYEVTGVLKPGKNYLAVEVANVLNNRLVGDYRRPESQRQTRSNVIKGPTPWTKPWSEVPLLESGLLGPVTVQALR